MGSSATLCPHMVVVVMLRHESSYFIPNSLNITVNGVIIFHLLSLTSRLRFRISEEIQNVISVKRGSGGSLPF